LSFTRVLTEESLSDVISASLRFGRISGIERGKLASCDLVSTRSESLADRKRNLLEMFASRHQSNSTSREGIL
jgi:hypothetical protein